MKHDCDTCMKHCEIRPSSNYCGAYYPYESNTDYIRHMSDEELAEWLLAEDNTASMCHEGLCLDGETCKKCMVKWLKEEYKE